MTTAPAPGSPEWLRLVTASKVAAILGVSPYDSPRSIYHKMRGDIGGPEVSAAMARGNYLEAGVLAWWQDRHPEYEYARSQYYATRDDLPWAAATLDAYAWGAMPDGSEDAAVEVKTTSRMDEWGEPGTDVIPTHYLVQTYWQMAMAPTVARVYVAVLGPFLEFSEYVVERPDESILDDLIARCHAFYLSLSADVPPELDDRVATFEVLRQMNGPIDKGAVAVIPDDLAAEFLTARTVEDQAVSRARAADSRVLEAAGAAQYVHSASGVRVARRQANRRRPIPTATPADLTQQETAA